MLFNHPRAHVSSLSIKMRARFGNLPTTWRFLLDETDCSGVSFWGTDILHNYIYMCVCVTIVYLCCHIYKIYRYGTKLKKIIASTNQWKEWYVLVYSSMGVMKEGDLIFPLIFLFDFKRGSYFWDRGNKQRDYSTFTFTQVYKIQRNLVTSANSSNI